jgi:hypothetical protein
LRARGIIVSIVDPPQAQVAAAQGADPARRRSQAHRHADGYKAFKRSAVAGLELRENRFGIEPEIAIELARRRLVFCEVGSHYHGRTYDQGKKIGWRDALRALYCILRRGLGG